MAEEAKEIRRRSELIIHASSVAAAGAAAITVLPGADAIAIMPIQIAMVTAVSHEYGVTLSASIVKSTVYAGLGKIIGKAGAGLILRWTPVAGNIVRASVAFAVTEALGKLLLERLESGDTLGQEIDLNL